MALIAANGEKDFEYYLDLPGEVRTMVIDEMQADDRCRFTRCSKRSLKEARASKNFLHELDIRIAPEEISISVMFTESLGFSLKFVNELEYLRMRYFGNWIPLWEETFYDIPDWIQFFVQHCRNLLQKYHKSIKHLNLVGPQIRLLLNNDFEPKSLKRLEWLCIGNIDPSPFFAKLQRPLKALLSMSSEYIEVVRNSEQLYSVSFCVSMIALRLNYEQYSRLSASYIQTNMGELTVQNVVHFITSWQNGTLRDNFRKCTLHLDNSGFEKNELFDVFGRDVVRDNMNIQTTIRHDYEPGKTASLEYCHNLYLVLFRVNIREN